MAEHTAIVITNPEQHVHEIKHELAHIQHQQRLQFQAQHKIEALPGGAVAFSTICCGDPRQIRRHTVQLAVHVKSEELAVIAQHYAQQHAEEHAQTELAAKALQILAEGKPITGDCGCN